MFKYFAALPVTYSGLLGLWAIAQQQRAKLLPYVSLFGLAVFYIFVLPLMGYGYRFLFPVVCMIGFIGAVGSVALILRMYRMLFPRPRVFNRPLQRAGGLLLLSVSLGFISLQLLSGGYIFWLEVQSRYQPRPFSWF